MSCVNTFPKHSMGGGRYGANVLSTSSGHMTFHDIYIMTFHKWQETDSISTLQLASLPTLIEFAKCIRNLYYQGIISLWVWVITFPINVGNVIS